MGIRGLYRYVQVNYDWKDLKLDRDCSFVLDGNGISYHIVNRCELLWQYGGSYGVFKKSLQEFLQSLISACQSPLHIVFDGTDESGEKADTLRQRKEQRLAETITTVEHGVVSRNTKKRGPLLPIISEEFRSVITSFEQQGSIKVYVANGEADPVVVALANDLKGYVIGNDSDYYIYPIDKGYIPLDRLSYDMRTCQVYQWREFRPLLGLSPAILPTLIGNDVIEGVVSGDVSEAFSYLRRHAYTAEGCYSLEKFENHISSKKNLWRKYCANREKTKSIYEELPVYSDKYPGRTFDDKPIPDWMIKNFKHYKLANDLLEVLITPHPYLLHIVPDDPKQTSTKIFSRSIRQATYGIMFKRRDVIEIVRKGRCLKEEVVPALLPKVKALSIHEMTKTTEMNRISFLCYTLHCNDPERLTVAFELEWVLPVATLCYWSREAEISTDEVKFRALVLCFAVLKYEQSAAVDSSTRLIKLQFNVDTLHLYTQWQCVYYDAILLNQTLALPLPATSPSSVFDGKLVTYYSQMKSSEFDECIRKKSQEVQDFFDKIVSFVQNN